MEAPINSGALITAHYGIKYNKEIFVIPAEIYNKNFAGSHNLIKQGAKLVTSIEDILTEFDFKYELKHKSKKLKLSPKEEILLDLLRNEPKTIEQISQELDWPISEILSILSHMEIKGIIKNYGGKFYYKN